jgi:hypothetical protein
MYRHYNISRVFNCSPPWWAPPSPAYWWCSRTPLKIKEQSTRKLVLWRLGRPQLRQCGTSTHTIWHCIDLTQECFHTATLRPHRGRTVRPPPNCSVRPIKSGSKRWLWQSNSWVGTTENLAILCFIWGGRDSAEHRTQMVLIEKAMCHPTELHLHMSQPGMCPNLT